MSISDHGSSARNCVCRWSSGFASALNPAIQVLAGEKVCIQTTTPTQESASLASAHTRRIASEEMTTGLASTRTGISSD